MDEAEKLVKRAGCLVALQIRDMPYSAHEYPNPHDISIDGQNVVPPLLVSFLKQLVHDDKKQLLSHRPSFKQLGQGLS